MPIAPASDYRVIVQYARYTKNANILSHLKPENVEDTKHFLKRLDAPLYHRWLIKHQEKLTGQELNVQMYFTKFFPPIASDSLVNTTLSVLTHEFLTYLESRCMVIDYSEESVLIGSFEQIDTNICFFDFLKETYGSGPLEKRWSLVATMHNMQRIYEKNFYPPEQIITDIIEDKIPLETGMTVTPAFSDDVFDYCFCCGRTGKNYSAKDGFLELSSQRPQSRPSTKNPKICPVCILSVMISLIRTTRGSGQRKTDLVALRALKHRKPYDYVFSRLVGVTVGDSIATGALARQKNLGKTAQVYISSSTLPKYVLADETLELVNLSTQTKVNTTKSHLIKIFKDVLGYRRVWRSDEPAFLKAHYAILKGQYFSLFKHLAVLLSDRSKRSRNEFLDKGIYEMIKYEVVSMEERPDLVFGTALLIDAFMPSKFEKEDIKTEARKVAFNLEKPEEVLLRLRQINKEDYTILRRDFSNRAQYKLLEDLLIRIHKEEDYGDFREEQNERKAFIEDITKRSFDEQERLFLRFDDLLKIYLYIQKIFSEKYPNYPKRLKKGYSDFISRIKYALVARRSELTE